MDSHIETTENHVHSNTIVHGPPDDTQEDQEAHRLELTTVVRVLVQRSTSFTTKERYTRDRPPSAISSESLEEVGSVTATPPIRGDFNVRVRERSVILVLQQLGDGDLVVVASVIASSTLLEFVQTADASRASLVGWQHRVRRLGHLVLWRLHRSAASHSVLPLQQPLPLELTPQPKISYFCYLFPAPSLCDTTTDRPPMLRQKATRKRVRHERQLKCRLGAIRAASTGTSALLSAVTKAQNTTVVSRGGQPLDGERSGGHVLSE